MASLALGILVITVLTMFITISTIMPLMGVYSEWFWPLWFRFAIYNDQKHSLGFLATLILNFYLLILMARFVFRISRYDRGLQKRGVFHLFDTIQFVFYILNSLLGLIKRAITSIIFQVLFIGRLDKSLMPRKLELWDKSYVSYLGYMQLDLYYSHPILLTAVYEFLKATSPMAARTSAQVDMTQLRSSSGSWIRKAGSSSSLGRGSAHFKAVPMDASFGAPNNSPGKNLNEGGGMRKRVRAYDDIDNYTHTLVEEEASEVHSPKTKGDSISSGGDIDPQAPNNENDDIEAAKNQATQHAVDAAAIMISIGGKKSRGSISSHARQLSTDMTVCTIAEETTDERQRRRRIRNRWLLVYTLVNNPYLAYDRRTFGVPTHLRPRRRFHTPELVEAIRDHEIDSDISRPESPIELNEPLRLTEHGWINPVTGGIVKPLVSTMDEAYAERDYGSLVAAVPTTVIKNEPDSEIASGIPLQIPVVAPRGSRGQAVAANGPRAINIVDFHEDQTNTCVPFSTISSDA